MVDDHDTVPEPASGRTRGAAERFAAGRYELGVRIGKGGMGEVLDAFDTQLKRPVAIKRILDREPSDRALARFLREARVQARLDHPSIVPVHELGRDAEGRSFFVMKKLSGTTLREILRDSAPSPQRLLRAFADVCLAVELAHTRDVIHRDLKPENIMLGDFGEVYVLDWGVAKIRGESDNPELANADPDELATRVGTVIGTKGYMAPEQERGEVDVDARADVFALGCILHEILTGVQQDGSRPSAREPSVPPELDDLCVAALAADREQRLATARALATRVQHYLDGDRDGERRRALATEHLSAATSALSTGDDHRHRSVAMREAGRALALDPTRTEAAELIGRMMLEVPALPPEEVEQALDAERIVLLRRNGPAVGVSMLAVIVVSWFLYLQTEVLLLPIVILNALAIMLIGVAFYSRYSRMTARVLNRVAPLSAIAVAGMVAVVALLFPPILIATAFAALTAATIPYTLQHHRSWFTAYTTILLLLAVLVPGVAELAGLLPETIHFVPDGLHLVAPALRGEETMMRGFGFVYSTTIVAIAGWIGYLTRRSEQSARRQVHLQAWHLRQLVTRG